MYPGMFRPRSGTQHAYAYEDPVFDPYLARSFRPSHQASGGVYANSAYEDHLYHRQPQHFHGYHEPQNFPSDFDLNYRTRRAPHRHLAESGCMDPGYIDLRFLPAFTLGLGSGPSTRQQAAGAARHSQHGSPGPQARPNARQVPVEDGEVLPYTVLTSQFPGVPSRHVHPPSVRAPSRHAASQRSEADFDEDSQDRDQTLQDLAYDPRWVKHQQQAEEEMLHRQRAQEERDLRLAQQAKERRLQEEQERRLAQHLREKLLAEEEQERRLAYQHMQEERLQQLLYQRRRQQELAEEELRLYEAAQRQYEAAQRQHRLQQQRQRQQQQAADALLQQQRQEQESQRQQKLNSALLQQRHQQQQQQSRNDQQARAKSAAGEHQKVPQQQPQQQQEQQQEQEQQQQQQQQKDSDERLKGWASMQQSPDDATTIIHKLMRSNSVLAEQPMLQQLSKASAKLTELSEGLRDVTSCVSAIQEAEESGLPTKLKQCQGQLDSPEQLQKRLVELGERGMQVVLSMDELHSENDKVRSLRKRVVKKALALMEEIDNVKSNMLHSILVHANDDQSEFSMPASGAVSEVSEAAEEEDGDGDDVKRESEDEPSAESDHNQGEQIFQQVADALAGLKVAEGAVHAPTEEQQPMQPDTFDGGNDGK